MSMSDRAGSINAARLMQTYFKRFKSNSKTQMLAQLQREDFNDNLGDNTTVSGEVCSRVMTWTNALRSISVVYQRGPSQFKPQSGRIVTVRVRRSRGEIYSGHGRLRVCLSLAFPHYCTDPDVTLGNGMGCPLVVHC